MSSRAIPHMPEPNRLLTLEEAMKLSGLSQWTITRLVQQGQLRRFKREGRAYFDFSEVSAINKSSLLVAA